MTSIAASHVNRRFLFLALILAILSAVLVYAAISRSDSGGGTASAADVPVVVAKAAIPAGTTITAGMLEVRQVPQSAVGDGALTSLDEAVGKVARFPIAINEQMLASKFVSGVEAVSNDVLSNILEEGKRGMAITVDAVVGAGGLVLPGDYVDVFAVPDKLVGQSHPGAFLLAENVEVIAVEQTLVELPPSAPGLREGEEASSAGSEGDQRVRGAEAEPNPEAMTVTLMLTPEQASNLFCGDQLGTLRLAVRAFGDSGPSGLPVEICVINAEEA
ncbi:MAG: Flp pilus assembly protein CpaB [Chloroflexi bacterium RBG_16_68_14]|nr:MAG: Flp pilus assembly protein CpaB [Chloroflexi bacterium RBG_16_68_14]